MKKLNYVLLVTLLSNSLLSSWKEQFSSALQRSYSQYFSPTVQGSYNYLQTLNPKYIIGATVFGAATLGMLAYLKMWYEKKKAATSADIFFNK